MHPFALITLPARVGRRFYRERLVQTAAALSFTTLLGIVPLIAVVTMLIDQFSFFAGLRVALEKFLLANLLPEKAGTIIAKYVGLFAHRAERISWLGTGILAGTALMQMLTIEHAFNGIWKVRTSRPFHKRLAIHVLALLLGPLAFGGSVAGITYLASVSLGLVQEPIWLNALVFKVLPFVFLAALFGLLFWGVPNRRIQATHAAVGGLLAAAGFTLMQRLFGAYVLNFPTYTTIYGAFAAVPIFLTWLYCSWTVILLGALVTAEIPSGSGR